MGQVKLILFILLGLIYWTGFLSCNQPRSPPIRTYSLDTLYIAKVIYSECSICPLSEKLLIGSVVLNRVKDGRWGNCVEDVVFYPNQFYQASGGTNWKTNEECYRIARILMSYGSVDSLVLYFFQDFNKTKKKKIKIRVREKYHIFAY